MKVWEWECLTGHLSTCSVVECGPLHGPIEQFKLTRDEDLKLILETVSAAGSSSKACPVLTGTVRISVEEVQFTGYSGDTAVARGVVPYTLVRSDTTSSESFNTEISQVHAVEWKAAGVQETAHTIQWLENMPDQFIWPHSVDRERTEGNTVTYHGDDLDIKLNDSSDSHGFGRSCVHLSLDGSQLFVVKTRDLKIENIRSPGFIIYQGSPTDDFQAKVRNILSFCLGQFLVDLGFTYFDQDWRPVYFKARSGHTMQGAAFKLVTLPPTLLNRRSYNEIDKSTLEHMMKALWDVYDPLDLPNVLWAYWHAAAAPAHIAAVHYGAAIESLQRRYAEKQGTKFKTTLLDTDQWKILSNQIQKLVSDSGCDDETKSILTRKVQSLNFAPQSIIMERFLSELGIEGGAVELSAWNKRNRAAHGSKIPENKFIEVIRDNKALMILLNRILLAVSGASGHYCNYYTAGHPVSALASPIPAED
ncbi:hypothetical protein [Paraburkholderia caribensis]|uniref:hypothetical protein n=1 Tax=Paraburkholderia caribensis TaxID=75105 RepID=UPI00078C7AA9|nr:hypothetical protein [Paraburkholderia caribensis]AMV41763.1 hypothetical protein ATN79_03570 [Paraburkholderia caribensis]